MNQHKTGQANAEFAIIAGLVLLAAIGSMVAFGGELNNFFTRVQSSNSQIQGEKTQSRILTANNTTSFNKNYTVDFLDYKPGSLQGTIDNPKQTCSNGTCFIDFGDFVLNGIPENFNSYVDTNGAAGGTDKLMAILEQLSDTLAQDGLSNESNMIKDLANLGHNIAKIEGSVESWVNNCNGDYACLSAKLDQPFPVPPGFNASVGKFPSDVTYYNANSLSLVGLARCEISVGTDCSFSSEEALAQYSEYPAYKYSFKYDEVMANPNISDNIKGIVKELTWTLGTMGEDFEEMTNYLIDQTKVNPQGVIQGHSWDPLTGESLLYSMDYSNTNAYSYYQSYDASGTSNLASSLKCGAAGGSSINNNCH